MTSPASSLCSRPHSSELVFSVEFKLLPLAHRPTDSEPAGFSPALSGHCPYSTSTAGPLTVPRTAVPWLQASSWPFLSTPSIQNPPPFKAWPSSIFSLPPFWTLLPPMLRTPNTSSPCQGSSLCWNLGFPKAYIRVDVSCRVELTYKTGSVPFLFLTSK